jgi:hypothetical protein
MEKLNHLTIPLDHMQKFSSPADAASYLRSLRLICRGISPQKTGAELMDNALKDIYCGRTLVPLVANMPAFKPMGNWSQALYTRHRYISVGYLPACGIRKLSSNLEFRPYTRLSNKYLRSLFMSGQTILKDKRGYEGHISWIRYLLECLTFMNNSGLFLLDKP